ncbi:MAG: hypothetical protein K2Q01_03735 [Rickettsiales bacterium]|nr:hypothetical protein [Rickettsiales bacterium]
MKKMIVIAVAAMAMSACSEQSYNSMKPAAGATTKAEQTGRGIPTVYRDSFGNKTTIAPKKAFNQ